MDTFKRLQRLHEWIDAMHEQQSHLNVVHMKKVAEARTANAAQQREAQTQAVPETRHCAEQVEKLQGSFFATELERVRAKFHQMTVDVQKVLFFGAFSFN